MPQELLDRLDVAVVSLYYQFADGEPVREVDVADYGEFYSRLESSDESPITSPPTPEDFRAAYEPLLDAGHGIVSVHISSSISDTCANARRAAEELGAADRIRVVDSTGAGAQTALVAIAAAKAAGGGELEQVAGVAQQARQESKIYWLLDTLEYLKRGGRIGTAAAWIGSRLQVKPILTVESDVRAVERVRTRERGIERLVDFARERRALGADAWALGHIRVPEDAQALAKQLQEVFWRPPEFVSEVGPVIGTHSGPGFLGLSTLPSRFLAS